MRSELKWTSAFFTGALITLASCTVPQETDNLQGAAGDTETTQAAADLEIERAETRMELIALRDRIDARISDVDRHLQMMDRPEERQQELQQYRTELVENRQRVEQELSSVEVAETSTWENVRNTADRTMHDVEEWFNSQGERVQGWFEGDDTPEDTGSGTGTESTEP